MVEIIREISLDAGDVIVQGRLSAVDGVRKPLLVGIHGIGYDARYFDAKGASVHERAAAAGFSMLSITRPGYPATGESAKVQPTFAESAHVLSAAIASFWSSKKVESPGVVVLGHSVGGAIAVHLAALMSSPKKLHAWPLLGVAISGIGNIPAPSAVERFASAPRDVTVTLPFSIARAAFYGPPESMIPGTEENLAELLVSFPSADAVEVNTTWKDDLPRLACEVRVPVHITLAELDLLWDVSPIRLRELTNSFERAPRVTSAIMPATGHNIEHHRSGGQYFEWVSTFSESCTPSTPS